MTTKLALTSGGGGAPFADDVFASWVYTGTSAVQNIVNGINLSISGGMVWTKSRTSVQPHLLTDTVRGVTGQSSTTSGYGGITTYTNAFSAFNTNGYALGADPNGQVNSSGGSFVSWTFRRAARFFDVVTYTGNGTARTIAHSLGIEPGFIMVKRTDGTGGSFFAYHRSAGAGNSFDINGSSGPAASATIWNNTAPTVAAFSVGADTNSNASGAPYVAYLFAHDTATDGIIQCGSYTGNGSATGPTVTLGWEPQFLLTAVGSGINAWSVVDTLRGMSSTQAVNLQPGNVNTENDQGTVIGLMPNGFQLTGFSNLHNAVATYYYVAIRRPMRQPTSASQVFSPHTYTGSGAARTITTPGFRVDAFIGRRTQSNSSGVGLVDRVRGPKRGTYLNTNSPDISMGSTEDFQSFAVVDGYSLVNDLNFSFNASTQGQVAYALRRARGFFDQVRYVGDGVARTISHQLGVVPEMMLVRCNQQVTVYHSALGAGYYQSLISAGGGASDATVWNNTAPTASVFSVGTSTLTNLNTENQAYLFATLAGISKVGSYTGNGTSQTINCGFSSGARFVMIKRATTTGAATTSYSNGWCVADTARGLVAAADPVCALNNVAADNSTWDWIDPDNSGFIINQDANTDLNVNGVQYLYLAIA